MHPTSIRLNYSRDGDMRSRTPKFVHSYSFYSSAACILCAQRMCVKLMFICGVAPVKSSWSELATGESVLTGQTRNKYGSQKKNSKMEGLAAYGSDDEEEKEDDDYTCHYSNDDGKIENRAAGEIGGIEQNSATGDNTSSTICGIRSSEASKDLSLHLLPPKATAPPMKKHKPDLQVSHNRRDLLPVPPTSPSLIYWKSDYLTRKQQTYVLATAEKKDCNASHDGFIFRPSTGWKAVSNERGNSSISADPSHDFNNPSFFATAVDRLGIATALGRHESRPAYDDGTAFATWEMNELEKLEHQARAQQQALYQHEHENFHAVPSEFAQQQLDRALQRHMM